MPADFLKKIVAHKKELLKERAAYYATLKKNMAPKDMRRYQIFRKAISKPGINLIAEVKKASPSVGLIREDFNAVTIANIYAKHKAAALSVLTEEKYFLGKMPYLKKVTDDIDLPVLMKDFIIHEHQVYEGCFNGASAVLLIVAMLEDNQMKDLMDVAHGLGIDCLVEVHEEAEIDRAMKVGADIIGVNNRDLRSLVVDVQNCVRMIPRIPKDKIIVAESGLRSAADVQLVKNAGANAVLIGETFMRAPDIASKMKEIMEN